MKESSVLKNHLRNRRGKRRIKNALKESLSNLNQEEAKSKFSSIQSIVAKVCSAGSISKNKRNRIISRISLKLL